MIHRWVIKLRSSGKPRPAPGTHLGLGKTHTEHTQTWQFLLLGWVSTITGFCDWFAQDLNDVYIMSIKHNSVITAFPLSDDTWQEKMSFYVHMPPPPTHELACLCLWKNPWTRWKYIIIQIKFKIMLYVCEFCRFVCFLITTTDCGAAGVSNDTNQAPDPVRLLLCCLLAHWKGSDALN